MADVSASQTNKETARPVGCAAVGEERALRMRRAPCGYAPYGYERTFAVGADGTFASAASGGYSEQKGVAAVEI